MPLRVNPKVLKLTLKRLAVLRAAILALSIELVGLQAVAIVAGRLVEGLLLSSAGILLAIVYVFSQPELIIFSWEEEPGATP